MIPFDIPYSRGVQIRFMILFDIPYSRGVQIRFMILFDIPYSRGVQIPFAKSPWWLNLFTWVRSIGG